MELYYLCIDFVFQFIMEKYRKKLNQIKSTDPYKHISNHAIHQTLNWESLKSRRVKDIYALIGLQK